ncbi:MAG: AMP-binding protein [Acidobacteria bacterium]|nr:AMP-binding protein [Acidobacteriota bacterium]
MTCANQSQTVGAVGRHICRVTPGKLALDDGSLRLTYGELDEQADRVASALAGRGLARGDVACALLPNCAAYAIVVLGVARAGCVFSPINPRLTPEEIAELLQIAHPGVLFTSRVFVARAREAQAIARQPQIRVVSIDGGDPDGVGWDEWLRTPLAALRNPGEEDFFSLIFTSGTTGKPKGALATHRARMLWVLNAAITYGLSEDDVYLGTMPQVHSAGLTFTLMHLYVGGTVLILPEFDARQYLELVEARAVTSSLMVPTMVVMVLDELDRVRRYRVETLRRLVTCGSPLAPATKRRALDRLTPHLYDYYGSTESNSMTVLKPRDQLRKPRSVGQPFANVEIMIAGPEGGALPPGEIGEVWCRNPSLMTGYLGDPEATAAAFADGWFKTGDLGFVDDENFLHLAGRVNELINSGGLKIFPAEIEEHLMAHPGVLDCSVVGAPDSKWGQVVAAFIVPRSGFRPSLEDVQAFCAARFADYKKPRRLALVAEIPKNAGGKIIKSRLLAELDRQDHAHGLSSV